MKVSPARHRSAAGRRAFLSRMSALAGAAVLPGCGTAPEHADAAGLRDRNKAIAVRFKEAQAEKDGEATIAGLLSPKYRRTRAGIEHLAANAQGQGFPGPGLYLRTAFPDRVDVIEQVIAEGDTVGMLFRVTGTHRANFFGIPATGRKIDIYEIGILRIIDGRITEGWFMADEAGLLKQLGAKLPPRKDGKIMVPAVTNGGEDPDIVLKRLQSQPVATPEDRHRLTVAQSKSSSSPRENRAADYKQLRQGFQHLRDYGVANRVAKETPTRALPDRRDRIDGFIAEGDTVWMRFKIAGTHKANLYGFPATGRRVEIPEIAIARFAGDTWRDAWYFGDELGMMLQLGALHMLG